MHSEIFCNSSQFIYDGERFTEEASWNLVSPNFSAAEVVLGLALLLRGLFNTVNCHFRDHIEHQ